jgi:hypothetical protein
LDLNTSLFSKRKENPQKEKKFETEPHGEKMQGWCGTFKVSALNFKPVMPRHLPRPCIFKMCRNVGGWLTLDFFFGF